MGDLRVRRSGQLARLAFLVHVTMTSYRRLHSMLGEPVIALLQALHTQFLWQQSAASDCNQERQHTLTNHCCSLSSAVSSALCCRSISPFLWSLSCRTASAQVLGVLSMMHTAARADRKELLAQKALCRSRQERWHGANMRLLCTPTNQLIIIKVHNIIRH